MYDGAARIDWVAKMERDIFIEELQLDLSFNDNVRHEWVFNYSEDTRTQPKIFLLFVDISDQLITETKYHLNHLTAHF